MSFLSFLSWFQVFWMVAFEELFIFVLCGVIFKVKIMPKWSFKEESETSLQLSNGTFVIDLVKLIEITLNCRGVRLEGLWALLRFPFQRGWSLYRRRHFPRIWVGIWHSRYQIFGNILTDSSSWRDVDREEGAVGSPESNPCSCNSVSPALKLWDIQDVWTNSNSALWRRIGEAYLPEVKLWIWALLGLNIRATSVLYLSSSTFAMVYFNADLTNHTLAERIISHKMFCFAIFDYSFNIGSCLATR